MTTLQSPRFSLSSLSVLALLVGLWILPLVYSLPNPWGSLLIKELHESGHSFLFLVFQLSLLALLKRTRVGPARREWQLLTLATGISLGAGGLIELIQPMLGRSASLLDMWRDFLGVFAANCLYISCLRQVRPAYKVLGLTLCAGALLVANAKVLPLAKAEWLRDTQFPLLSRFDEPALDVFASSAGLGQLKMTPAPPGWTENNSRTAQVFMPADTRWPGFFLRSPYPDWGNYDTLNFDVYSPLTYPVQIAVNVYSEQQGTRPLRYRAFEVKPGLNQLTVTLGKPKAFASQSIRQVLWYSITEDSSFSLYFDNIRLE